MSASTEKFVDSNSHSTSNNIPNILNLFPCAFSYDDNNINKSSIHNTNHNYN